MHMKGTPLNQGAAMKLPHGISGLTAIFFLTLSSQGHAAPVFYVSIGGTPLTQAETFDGTNHGEDQHSSPFSSGQLSQSSASSGLVSSSSAGEFFNISTQTYEPQEAEASYSGTASIGALHATAAASSTISGLESSSTAATLNRLELFWHDTVTFQTSNPRGSDFTLGLFLNDTISTTLSDGAGFVLGTAQAILEINSGPIVDVLSITDTTKQTAAQILSVPPASRDMIYLLHVMNGEIYSFTGGLYLTAVANDSDSSVSIDAANTALFSLYSADPAASYFTASGVTFATAEPSTWALCISAAIGMASFGWLNRRRRVIV
jgi:hypothetical protein